MSGTTASASANNNAARNAFSNALANTGHGPTSAGAAVSTAPETMIRSPPSPITSRATRRCQSIIEGLFVASTISFNLRPGTSLGEGDRRDQGGDRAHP